MTVFGTRPEAIKLAPVIRELSQTPSVRSLVVCSGQHRELLAPLVQWFELSIDHNLDVMQAGQSSNQLLAKILQRLDPLLTEYQPDIVLVQGDTTTALGGAMAAFHRGIAVGHVEAGLRTDNPLSPFPEEMNRRLISRITNLHFAATARNGESLLAEGVAKEDIYHTGNPVVDALQMILQKQTISPSLQTILDRTQGLKRITLTTHRRESFGKILEGNLQALADFVAERQDVTLIFPVHPNPVVREASRKYLSDLERVHLLDPLEYSDFLGLLSHSWLIVSDSGGVQEEAPTLGVPLLVLRANTERPEGIDAGCAKLVGDSPTQLARYLEEAYESKGQERTPRENPFGQGDSRKRIVAALLERLDTLKKVSK